MLGLETGLSLAENKNTGFPTKMPTSNKPTRFELPFPTTPYVLDWVIQPCNH